MYDHKTTGRDLIHAHFSRTGPRYLMFDFCGQIDLRSVVLAILQIEEDLQRLCISRL